MLVDYSQNSNYVSLVGLGVVILAKFGIQTDASTIFTIIGGIVALIGIVKQMIAHRKLAQIAGAIPRS